MIKVNFLFVVLLCCLFTACNKEGHVHPTLEGHPISNRVHVGGDAMVIQGNVDGEQLLIKDEGGIQMNLPSHSDTHTDPNFIGTTFRIGNPGQTAETYIQFGFNRDGDSTFEDIVRVGTYDDWYDFTINAKPGQIAVKDFKFKGASVTNATWPNSNSNPDSYFEVTSVTSLEQAEYSSERYSGKLYRVEGHFATDLDKWDNSGDVPRLTVEHFSAIFYDERP